MEEIKLVIKIPEKVYEQISNPFIEEEDIDYLKVITAIENGVPLREICDKEKSELKNRIKDLSERVENIEKLIKEDKEEQLKKLKVEVDYEKFSCDLAEILTKRIPRK